jgi:hypothetical protein
LHPINVSVQLPQYSNVYGVAQVQLGPPAMQLPSGSTTQAEIHTLAMIRYFPNTSDPKTDPLSPFLRGEVVTTFTIKTVSSAAGTNIVVDLASPGANVHFNPAWSAGPLNANDRNAINLAIANILTGSFQPSSTPLPSKLLALDFKGFPASSAVAMLMNVTTQNSPTPNSVQNVFLNPDDQFALALNGDVIVGTLLGSVRNNIPKSQTIVITVNWQIGFFSGTFHVTVGFSVGTITVELLDDVSSGSWDADTAIQSAGIPGRGVIRVTVPAQVTFSSNDLPPTIGLPSSPVDVTLSQLFTLILTDGAVQGIQTIGGLDVEVSGDTSIGGALYDAKNEIQKQATGIFNNFWASQQGAINQQVAQALSPGSLQTFLDQLMNPAGGKGAPIQATLAFTSFAISPAGIVLHGTLTVPSWPAADVEFDNDPSAPLGKYGYQALNSWIPGGTIQQYQWTFGAGSPITDNNRFIVENAPAFSWNTCLNFGGQRISASGPVVYQTVNAGMCRSPAAAFSTVMLAAGGQSKNPPLVAVIRPVAGAPTGLEVVAHTSPWVANGNAPAPANLLVHFPDASSVTQLDVLPRALTQSGRGNASAAILAVLTSDQLAAAKAVDTLMYSDDAETWAQLLTVGGRPATVLINPSGKIVWRSDGPADLGALTDALRRNLAAGAQVSSALPSSPLRVGDRSPNFMFEFPPGQTLTLRKLAGKPAVLVFFRSPWAPGIETIHRIHRLLRQPGVEPAVLVAIDDGGDGQFARGLAAGEEGAIIVAPDPQRQISLAYGINLWPTVVWLDAEGLVRSVQFGLISQSDLLPLPGVAASS